MIPARRLPTAICQSFRPGPRMNTSTQISMQVISTWEVAVLKIRRTALFRA